MKCAWSPCDKEAIVDDGYCSNTHMRQWMSQHNKIPIVRDMMFPCDYINPALPEPIPGWV
jgi:hypothetical protein